MDGHSNRQVERLLNQIDAANSTSGDLRENIGDQSRLAAVYLDYNNFQAIVFNDFFILLVLF